MTTGVIHKSFPVAAVEQDGADIKVVGRCSDGEVDSDGDVVSPLFMKQAVDEWLRICPALRLEHHDYPAGRGLRAWQDGGGATWVESLVADDKAKRMVKSGRLRAYSVGIHDPQTRPHPKASRWEIYGGRLTEVSLVSSPANARCGITVCKSVNGVPQFIGKAWNVARRRTGRRRGSVASTSRKLVAEAVYRVVARNMAAGRSLSYDQLLAETGDEVDVLLDKRGERNARLLRQARKRVVEDQVRLEAAKESRAAADAGRQLADLEAVPGPPVWHPEHSDHPESLLGGHVDGEDVTKGKKRRRRSARVYINVNRPVDPAAAALIHEFPGDDDPDGDALTPAHARARAEVGKRDIGTAERERLAREGKALVNPDGHVSYPIETEEDLHTAAHLARTGHGDVKRAKKLIARRAKELGVSNPLESQKATGNPAPHPDGGSWTDRLSPSRVVGQGAASSGDHNAAAWQDPMSGDGPRAQFLRHPLARGHADLQQSTTTPFPMGMMRTYNGSNEWGDRDVTLGMGRVSVQRLDAAAASGLSSAPGNPVSRRMDHTAPINTGGPNGGHSLSQPESRHPMSMKNSERLDAMKRMLFPGSGGGR